MKKDTQETLEQRLYVYKVLLRRKQKGMNIDKQYIRTTMRSLEYRLKKFEDKPPLPDLTNYIQLGEDKSVH